MWRCACSGGSAHGLDSASKSLATVAWLPKCVLCDRKRIRWLLQSEEVVLSFAAPPAIICLGQRSTVATSSTKPTYLRARENGLRNPKSSRVLGCDCAIPIAAVAIGSKMLRIKHHEPNAHVCGVPESDRDSRITDADQKDVRRWDKGTRCEPVRARTERLPGRSTPTRSASIL